MSITEIRDAGMYPYHLRRMVVPASWPDSSIFGDDAAPPAWFEPEGDVGFRRHQSADISGRGTDMGSGSQLICDAQSLTADQWQRQWWEDTPVGNTGVDDLVVLIDSSLSATSVELDPFVCWV